jgi:hypothetical protein
LARRDFNRLAYIDRDTVAHCNRNAMANCHAQTASTGHEDFYTGANNADIHRNAKPDAINTGILYAYVNTYPNTTNHRI